jgi:5-methylcytosine-specific restriction enzyme A
MSVEDQLTAVLEQSYRRAGEEVGYWGRRFLQAVRRKGGLATVRRMLKPRTTGQRAGLDALLDANRPDLTVEAIILKPKFRRLFSKAELHVASERLGEYGKLAAKRAAEKDRLYPDELEPGQKYVEGARKQVRVNAYERNPAARDACIKHHGWRCTVCDLLFEDRYGAVGREFIHVHHLKPLALRNCVYALDPVNDLRPVCPNCHAMLHRGELSIQELRAQLNVHAPVLRPVASTASPLRG